MSVVADSSLLSGNCRMIIDSLIIRFIEWNWGFISQVLLYSLHSEYSLTNDDTCDYLEKLADFWS